MKDIIWLLCHKYRRMREYSLKRVNSSRPNYFVNSPPLRLTTTLYRRSESSQSLARATASSVDEPTSSRAKKMFSVPKSSQYLDRPSCSLRSSLTPVSNSAQWPNEHCDRSAWWVYMRLDHNSNWRPTKLSKNTRMKRKPRTCFLAKLTSACKP